MLVCKYDTLLRELKQHKPCFTDLEKESYFILRRINNPYQSRFTQKDKLIGLDDAELMQEFSQFSDQAFFNRKIAGILTKAWGSDIPTFASEGDLGCGLGRQNLLS
jgi:hypothetical protein